MANVSFIRGSYEKINAQSKVDGQILVAKDTKQLFVDVGETRLLINDVIVVSSLGEATTADVNKFYYVTDGNIFAKSNGTSWTQINAQQVIAEGTDNGTISVGGKDVSVHGLGSAAFTDADNYDVAGTAVTEANKKVGSVTAGDDSVTIAGEATAPTVAVKLSDDEDNALKLVTDGLKVELDAAPEYVIEKEGTATEGYLATYVLKKDGVQAGVKIDIPKDYLVKTATVETVEIVDQPYIDAVVGDKYIDFTVNTVGDDGNESHIYLSVKDLVTPYTAGNGIEISGSNEITVKVDKTNGLSVNETGISLAVATAENSGAMSGADKAKLDEISAGAEANYVKSVTEPFTVNESGQLSATDATTDKSGLMSVSDKTKVDGIEAGAQVNKVEKVTLNGVYATMSGTTAQLSLAWTDLADD